MLRQALLAGVEAGLERVLRLDPTARPRLARLAGKVIEVQGRAPDLHLFLLPGEDGIRLAGHWEAPADCVLRAPLSSLLRLATAHDKVAVLHGPEVELDGDSSALLDLAEVLQDLELDWEYELSRWLGPVAAGLLGGQARSSGRHARQTFESLKDTLADYLAEESRVLVGRREAEARFAELDDLKLALDRLDARVERLIQQAKPTA